MKNASRRTVRSTENNTVITCLQCYVVHYYKSAINNTDCRIEISRCFNSNIVKKSCALANYVCRKKCDCATFFKCCKSFFKCTVSCFTDLSYCNKCFTLSCATNGASFGSKVCCISPLMSKSLTLCQTARALAGLCACRIRERACVRNFNCNCNSCTLKSNCYCATGCSYCISLISRRICCAPVVVTNNLKSI